MVETAQCFLICSTTFTLFQLFLCIVMLQLLATLSYVSHFSSHYSSHLFIGIFNMFWQTFSATRHPFCFRFVSFSSSFLHLLNSSCSSPIYLYYSIKFPSYSFQLAFPFLFSTVLLVLEAAAKSGRDIPELLVAAQALAKAQARKNR